ncbi:DUF397 domain-containing protein [Thermomonospora curvata]|uniref:DUF397 domain-containing protein n=1 Tax=Thermomonospora curvata (strain ATCC 19995 / DSM 43183 / JCM 3096 / KCTC 9072 / NBRC 15933 / NCIMB 10081 / Henssen B9) TaxID=471852 RepID=D1A9L2_THECD|nr:DUF397 domain-containing protein [Thermomonospora curvata]ACY98698.1 protein of unknown function DUF397 [Thermomonospora curvata DSM 43183]
MVNRDRSPLARRKSSHSNRGGDRVEIAAVHGAVAIRDSKAPDAPCLLTAVHEWHSPPAAVKYDVLGR